MQRSASPGDATSVPVADDRAREAAERVAFAANAVPALLAYVDSDVRYVWVNEGSLPVDPAPSARVRSDAPLRVLVVDDNVDAAVALGQVMEILGHEVSVVHDGPAALAATSAAAPNLILLGIGLPGMEGYEVASRLRAAGHTRATLVALTGYGREDDVRRSRDAGFDHHLVKPVELAQLRKITADLRV